MQSIDPATGTVVARYEAHTAAEAAAMAGAAGLAFGSWRRTPYAERAGLLSRVADVLDARLDEFTRLMTAETGKTVRAGRAEIEKCAWVCRYYAAEGERMLADREVEAGRTRSYIHYEPLGAVLAVMPWNFPFWQVFRSWRRTPFTERAELLSRVADVLEARLDEFTGLMTAETGKTVRAGRAEIEKCAWVCRYYAAEGERMLADREVEAGRTRSYVHYQPLGAVLAVMPWNFPFWQVFRFAAPALMAGNVALLKHASNVSGCALAIAEAFAEAGSPPNVFQTLLVPGSRVLEVIEHPAVVAATLTGSEEAGRDLASRCGGLLKKTVLELGGSDPYLVLEDADLDLAASTCSDSRLINSGQSCIAAKRFIVHEAVHDAWLEKFLAAMEAARVGDPADEATDVGPLARHDLRDELHRQVAESIAAGATLQTGGEIPAGPGAFYPPTVLTGVVPGMPAYDEELFGPVAAVIRVGSEDEAVAVANDTRFGLGAAVFTTDLERGRRLAADRLEAGTCVVNTLVASDPRLPFGGIKASGYGRELADAGIREFVNTKTVVVG